MSKIVQVLVLPLLCLDCFANMCVGGSITNTLSGEAWYHKEHKYWGWCYKFINTLFFWQEDHCKGAAQNERDFGGMWGAWKEKWK